MHDGAGEVLPYRTEPHELLRWLEAVARGGELELAPKTQEGLTTAAVALGLLERGSGRLTPVGERLVLADAGERRAVLRAAMLRYAPYRRLLEALAQRAERAVTEVHWVETWWATHGYGNSQSNRTEATAVLGRLAEYVGWGRYIPGRRGHPTRIEWVGAVFAALPAAPAPSLPASPAPAERGAEGGGGATVPPPTGAVRGAAVGGGAGRGAGADGAEYNRVSVPLAGGGLARLEVPLRLPREEKRRLLAVLELLIAETDA